MPSAHPDRSPDAPLIRYRALAAVSKTIVAHRDLETLSQDLAGRVRPVVDFDNLALALHEKDSNAMRVRFLEGYTILNRSDLVFSLDGTPEADIWQKQQPTVLSDAAELQSLPSLAKVLEPVGINSVCLLPLITTRGRLGVLAFASYRPSAYDSEDLDFLRTVADQVAVAVENAKAFRDIEDLNKRLSQEKAYLEEEVRTEHNFEEIVGQSAVLRRVLKEVEIVAPTDSTVLIRGDTGTGKELIARAIHKLSPRHERTFVTLNCAAIPTGLLESELFGHEKGAFTGAISQKVGRFELANNTTLFLDEVGDIPLELQPKLLRVLQEKEFERLGSTKTIKVDVRLVAATHRDLAALVADGRFRGDLYYRLNVFPVMMPLLRERPDDIPRLTRCFVQRFARRMGRQIETIPPAVIDALVRYPWPGNVRELQNVVERAVIRSTGATLVVRPEDLESGGQKSDIRDQKSEIGSRDQKDEDSALTPDSRPPTSSRKLADAERECIPGALNETRNEAAAARLLDVARSTLQHKMRKLGISRPK